MGFGWDSNRRIQNLHPDVIEAARAHVEHGIEQAGQRANLSRQFTEHLMNSGQSISDVLGTGNEEQARYMAGGMMSMGQYRTSTDMRLDVQRGIDAAKSLGHPLHQGDPYMSDRDNEHHNSIAVQLHLTPYAHEYARQKGVEAVDI